MIKVGERAILKASEEVVFVLKLEDISADNKPVEGLLYGGGKDFPELTQTMALVRRPVFSGDRGLYHAVERFFIDELETLEEHMQYDAKNFKKRLEVSKEAATDNLAALIPEKEVLN